MKRNNTHKYEINEQENKPSKVKCYTCRLIYKLICSCFLWWHNNTIYIKQQCGRESEREQKRWRAFHDSRQYNKAHTERERESLHTLGNGKHVWIIKLGINWQPLRLVNENDIEFVVYAVHTPSQFKLQPKQVKPKKKKN